MSVEMLNWQNHKVVLTLQLLECVASLEIFATFSTGTAFCCGILEDIPWGAGDSCALGCGRSGFENIQVQGFHGIVGQHTPVISDLYRDFIFPSLSRLNLSHSTPFATGRDTSHKARLIQAPPDLALNTSRMEQLQLLWVVCIKFSPPSQVRISS